jgi:fucose 4-O-acetylase-like acetyltransferase
MEAFSLISGFFSKTQDCQVNKAPIIKFVFAYIIFNTTVGAYCVIIDGMPLKILTPYLSNWYILALIVWRLCIQPLSKVRGILITSLSAALLIGFWNEFTNILAISRTIAFFPFFLLGYWLVPERVEAFIRNRRFIHFAIGTVVFFLSVAATSFMLSSYTWNLHSLMMIGYNGSIKALAIRGMIFVFAGIIIISLGLMIPAKAIPLITVWGRNSLAIYLLHRVFALAFVRGFPPSRYHNAYFFYAMAASGLTLLILGTDVVSRRLNSLLDTLTALMYGSRKRVLQVAVSAILIAILLIPLAQTLASKLGLPSRPPRIYPAVSGDPVNF